LCGSRKYPYTHHRGSLEVLRGRGVLKYEPKLEFPGGEGSNQKTLPRGEYRHFVEQHIEKI